MGGLLADGIYLSSGAIVLIIAVILVIWLLR
ncbi:MAG: hypothetical protein K0S82_82 [Gaiellaceae bacterium]|jgi:hypothetical protein|nr:hypothetical protein [Gaiellaceae bacterium]